MLLVILVAMSAVAFLFYGVETLFAGRPRLEFERYGMPNLRVFVGSMQLLGATGVVIGIIHPSLGAVAAAGLTIMMLLGLAARYRIHDSPMQMIPATAFALLNASLVFLFVTQ